MRRFWHRAPREALLALTLFAVSSFALSSFALPASNSLRAAPVTSGVASSNKDNPKIPAARWDEQTPGCTYSHTDDGKLHYGMWFGDVGITLSLDSEELEKVHRRHEPFFAALLEVRYRGQGTLDLTTENISLEFAQHFQVVQTSLDPETFAAKIQSDADEVDHAAAREIEKHPEKKDAQQAYVRAFQKDSAELLEFISKNSLRPGRLGPGNPQAYGWVFFSVDSKWISGWRRQENFILRVPINAMVFEFPFQLPPKPGDVMLRRRP
jgi:hypothetical protein